MLRCFWSCFGTVRSTVCTHTAFWGWCAPTCQDFRFNVYLHFTDFKLKFGYLVLDALKFLAEIITLLSEFHCIVLKPAGRIPHQGICDTYLEKYRQDVSYCLKIDQLCKETVLQNYRLLHIHSFEYSHLPVFLFYTFLIY